MHPSMDELLAYRDGDSRPEIVRHVTICGSCATRVEQLRYTRCALCDLPRFEAPAAVWSTIADELERRRRTRMWTRGAAAAAVLLAVLVGTWAGLMSRPRQMAVSGLEADVQLEELMDASRTLERVMRTPGSTPAVLGAPEAARIAVIEDRIAAIDAALDLTDQPSERSRELALWSGRVELLDELIQVRNGYADRRGFARTSLVEGSFQ